MERGALFWRIKPNMHLSNILVRLRQSNHWKSSQEHNEKLGMMDLAQQARVIYVVNIPEDYESELEIDEDKPWYRIW